MMAKFYFLSLLILSSTVANAGGVQCQTNGTCECQFNKTCDQNGNLINPKTKSYRWYCKGQTQNYSLSLEVNHLSNSVSGMIYVGGNSQKIEYKGMHNTEACMKDDFFRLCFAKSNTEAEVQIIVQAENDFPVETGVLSCTAD